MPMMTEPQTSKVDYTSNTSYVDWTTVDHNGKGKILENNKATSGAKSTDGSECAAKKHNNGCSICFDGNCMDTLAKADDIKQYRSPTEVMQERGEFAVDKQDKWITPVTMDFIVGKDQTVYPIHAELLSLIDQFQNLDPSLT
eukprot:156348-Ditylum_brightwellii.AAC.1